MNPEATDALLHMLGLDDRHEEPWRNHYVGFCNEMAELLAAGLVEEGRASELTGGERVFRATDAGKRAARSVVVRRPKPSRGHARYDRWLDLHDVNSDVSFGDFLRRRMYL